MQLTTRAPPADRPTTTIVLRRRNIIASNEKIYFDDNPAATVAKNDNETTAPPATPPNHPPAHSREGESGRPRSYIGIPSPWRRLDLSDNAREAELIIAVVIVGGHWIPRYDGPTRSLFPHRQVRPNCVGNRGEGSCEGGRNAGRKEDRKREGRW